MNFKYTSYMGSNVFSILKEKKSNGSNFLTAGFTMGLLNIRSFRTFWYEFVCIGMVLYVGIC